MSHGTDHEVSKSANVRQLERIIPVAKRLLILETPEGRPDSWLWERAERVSRLVPLLGKIPEVANQEIDPLTLAVAGLFHCAGWATQVQQGQINHWQVLSRPTNDIQRVLGTALLQEHVAHLLPPKAAHLASEAIHQCNDRNTTLIEAQLLSEAENLDDAGVLYVLRQCRQYQAEGRPISQLVDIWRRQQEYHYWDVRINDGFRFETVRQLARERLQAIDSFMQALARDLDGTDLMKTFE